MSQYRIRGWFRDTLDAENILRFEAKDDEEAWKHELPPKFLSNSLERMDGGEWVRLKPAPEQFLAAISSVVTGIISKAHPNQIPNINEQEENEQSMHLSS